MYQEANVMRGVALLDRVYPEWRDEINLSLLDMGSSTRCILGQVFDKGYYGGLDTLFPFRPGMTYTEGIDYQIALAVEHGFQITFEDVSNNSTKMEEKYRELTTTWIDILNPFPQHPDWV